MLRCPAQMPVEDVGVPFPQNAVLRNPDPCAPEAVPSIPIPIPDLSLGRLAIPNHMAKGRYASIAAGLVGARLEPVEIKIAVVLGMKPRSIRIPRGMLLMLL